MKYALLIFTNDPEFDAPERSDRPMSPGVNAVLGRPEVTGWVRLRSAGSGTSLTVAEGRTLLTDGPFVGSKEFLGGLVHVDAPDLDAALAVAADLQVLRDGGRIEVRPVLQEHAPGA